MTPLIRRWVRLVPVLAAVGLVLTMLNPVHDRRSVVMVVGLGVLFWVAGLLLLWRVRWGRVLWLVLAVVLVAPFLLPERSINRNALRVDYVRRMSALERVRYVWGGESGRGIDCSGLPRRAYREAMLWQGIRTGNGRLTRGYLEQIWYDTSAKAMGEEYRGFTKALGIEGVIKSMDVSPLQPGDLAITTDGLHVVVYVGYGRWIQADPGVGSVVTLLGEKDDNAWFEMPVKMVRWSALDGGGTPTGSGRALGEFP